MIIKYYLEGCVMGLDPPADPSGWAYTGRFCLPRLMRLIVLVVLK
jgi:hypothetical protein